jgi:hypothetical protein
MNNKLPPCFAFKNSGKHPRKDEIKKRFNELHVSYEWSLSNTNYYYGRLSDGVFFTYSNIYVFGSTVVEITEDDFLDMTEPELTELPKVFAFKNDPDSPNHDLLVERFNSPVNPIQYDLVRKDYYGRHENGCVTYNYRLEDFGDSVVEITEQQFLDLTEPKLTKLPDNFYFQYVDEKDREVLKEMFGKITKYGMACFNCINNYCGIVDDYRWCFEHKKDFHNSTEITQADFIRLTEPATTYKGDIKDFPKEVVEWMLSVPE